MAHLSRLKCFKMMKQKYYQKSSRGSIIIIIAIIIMAIILLFTIVFAAAMIGDRTGLGGGSGGKTAPDGTHTITAKDTPTTTSGCDSTSELMNMYGSSPTQVRSQLVPINFMGKSVQVHRKAAPYFQAVIDDIKASGTTYKFRRLGTYNWRANRNNPGVLSTHSFGIAIDINDDVNCNGCTSTDIPNEVINAFREHGFRWGGDYKHKKDPMHFEFLGLCPGDESE